MLEVPSPSFFKARSMPPETDAAPGFCVMGYTLLNRVVNGLLKMERARRGTRAMGNVVH